MGTCGHGMEEVGVVEVDWMPGMERVINKRLMVIVDSYMTVANYGTPGDELAWNATVESAKHLLTCRRPAAQNQRAEDPAGVAAWSLFLGANIDHRHPSVKSRRSHDPHDFQRN